MTRKLAICLATAAIALGGSVLSASAEDGNGGGDGRGGIHATQHFGRGAIAGKRLAHRHYRHGHYRLHHAEPRSYARE
jgi:hypothetical protein